MQPPPGVWPSAAVQLVPELALHGEQALDGSSGCTRGSCGAGRELERGRTCPPRPLASGYRGPLLPPPQDLLPLPARASAEQGRGTQLLWGSAPPWDHPGLSPNPQGPCATRGFGRASPRLRDPAGHWSQALGESWSQGSGQGPCCAPAAAATRSAAQGPARLQWCPACLYAAMGSPVLTYCSACSHAAMVPCTLAMVPCVCTLQWGPAHLHAAAAAPCAGNSALHAHTLQRCIRGSQQCLCALMCCNRAPRPCTAAAH